MIYCLWWKKPLDVEEPEIIPVQDAEMEQLVAAMASNDSAGIMQWELNGRTLYLDVKGNRKLGKGTLGGIPFYNRYVTKRQFPGSLSPVSADKAHQQIYDLLRCGTVIYIWK